MQVWGWLLGTLSQTASFVGPRGILQCTQEWFWGTPSLQPSYSKRDLMQVQEWDSATPKATNPRPVQSLAFGDPL